MPASPDGHHLNGLVERERLLCAGSKLCGALATGLGLAVLAGWQFDIVWLRSFSPQWGAMQPVAAVGFVLAGLILLASRWMVVQAVLIGLLVVICGTELWQGEAREALGVDLLLFPDKVAGQAISYPGRMAGTCAIEFLLFCAAPILARTPRWHRQFLLVAVLGLTIAITLLAGHLFGAKTLATIGAASPIATPIALGFVILFTGVHLSQPKVGLAAMLASPRLGGVTARRVLPFVLGLPFAVGLLVDTFSGNAPSGTSLPLTLVLLMAGLAIVVVGMARRLDAKDREREEAVDALRRSEAEFRATQEASLFGMVILDPVRDAEGHIVDFRSRYINPMALRLMGMTRDEQDIYFSQCRGDADNRLLRRCIEVAEQGRPMDEEFMVGKEDRPRWFRALAVKLDAGVALSFFETTARKESERALKESELLFRAVFEQAAVGIELATLDGRLIKVNRKLSWLLGYEADDMIGQSFERFVHPHFVDDERHLLGELLTGRRASYVLEKQALRKDGSAVWVRVTSSLAGGVDAIRVTIFEDITQQQRVLEELRATATRLELALDGARAGIWEWDLLADRQMWSPEIYRLIGLETSTPPTADTWVALVDHDDLERCRKEVRNVLARGGTQCRLDMRVHHPQAGTRWLSALGRISYRGDGRPTRMLGIALDITDLKRAEQEAKAAEEAAKQAKNEAERADLAKSHFLAAASHDLRQPVQAMMLLSEALLDRLKGRPETVVVNSMQAALNALQMLLGGLLDVSRLDAGVVKAEPRAIALGGVIERLAGEYGVRAKSKGLALRAVPSRLWARTDPVLFERILRNLLENALRYTQRGKVLIGCRRVGAVVRFYVADTGIGVAAEHQQAIFQEFFQVGNFERDREKGLGLGLSIVKRLTAILGHKLSMISELGRGSCFVVELPAELPPAVESGGVSEAAR